MATSPNLDKLRALTKKLNIQGHKPTGTDTTLKSFFEMTKDMLCIINKDGYFIRLNAAWSNTGWTINELKAQPLIEFIHKDDRKNTLKTLKSISDKSNNKTYFRNRYQCKDGSYKLLCWTGVMNADNKLFYMVVRDFGAMMESLYHN